MMIFKLLFKLLAVGIAVHHRGSEGSHLASVVAATNAEHHSPFGQDVHHRKVLSEPDRVPHGQDVEPAAKLDAFGELGQILAHNQQVGDALVPLALEVGSAIQRMSNPRSSRKNRRLFGNIHRRRESVIVVPTVVGGHTLKANAVAFQNMAGVQGRKGLNYRKSLRDAWLLIPRSR